MALWDVGRRWSCILLTHDCQKITIDEWPPECQVPEIVREMSTVGWIYLTDNFVLVFGEDADGKPRIVQQARTPEAAQAIKEWWDGN